MVKQQYRVGRGAGAFTLVELMVASSISALLILSVMSVFVYQLGTSRSQEMQAKLHQEIRTALDLVAMDTYMAGYGLPVPPARVSAWINWVPGMTNNPCIVDGSGGGPDTLYIAAASGPVEATLSQNVIRGSTILRVAGSTPNLNLTDRSVVFIGRREVARVVSILGSELTISTDPVVWGRGIKRNYPAGTEVELVRVIKYSLSPSADAMTVRSHLRRTDSATSYTFSWQQMVAANIEDFQVTRTGEAITLAISGRTENPDRHYTNPVNGDHYRRLTFRRTVAPRN